MKPWTADVILLVVALIAVGFSHTRANFLVRVAIDQFCDSDGMLLNGNHCDVQQFLGADCDLELQLCVDNAPDNSLSNCATGWKNTGLLQYDQNCDTLSRGQIYGTWQNPGNFIFSGGYYGINLKVIAKDYNFGAAPDSLVDQFVESTYVNPDGYEHQIVRYHQRPNRLQPTKISFSVVVICIGGSGPNCGGGPQTSTSYPWWRSSAPASNSNPWWRSSAPASTSYPWWRSTAPASTSYPWWRSSAPASTSYPWWRSTASTSSSRPSPTTYPWWARSSTPWWWRSTFQSASVSPTASTSNPWWQPTTPSTASNSPFTNSYLCSQTISSTSQPSSSSAHLVLGPTLQYCSCGQQQRYLAVGSDAVLTSPNYPGNYCNNLQCTWYLSSYQPGVVSLYFCNFDLETGYYDYVRVYRGQGTDSNQLIESCTGSSGCNSVNSNSYQQYQTLTVTFSSDSSVTRPGFRAIWQAQYLQ